MRASAGARSVAGLGMPTHLIVVNLGTPREADAESVREFLAEFLADPAVVDFPRWIWRPLLRGVVLRRRPARVAEAYRAIWGPDGSPLRAATSRMVAALARAGEGRLTVSAAYRYGEPSLESELRRLARAPVGRIVVVPLFPQRTGATTGTIARLVDDILVRVHVSARVDVRALAPDDPGYVAALADRWREALGGAAPAPEHLVVSFHGIPVRYDRREGGRYASDCETTTRALLRAIAWPRTRTTLAYQSRFGPERWLAPATADVIATLARRGMRRVAVITPGFLTDGLETLEEIGIRARDTFAAAGGDTLVRIAAVEDHDAVVEALIQIAIADTTDADAAPSTPTEGQWIASA